MTHGRSYPMVVKWWKCESPLLCQTKRHRNHWNHHRTRDHRDRAKASVAYIFIIVSIDDVCSAPFNSAGRPGGVRLSNSISDFLGPTRWPQYRTETGAKSSNQHELNQWVWYYSYVWFYLRATWEGKCWVVLSFRCLYAVLHFAWHWPIPWLYGLNILSFELVL